MTTAPNPTTDGLKMKTLVGLFSLALLLLTGCSSASGIVGAWQTPEGEKYEFFADGTFSHPGHPNLPREHLTYKLEGDKLHLAVREVFINKESTSRQEWTVKFPSNDTMEVEGEPWKRVK